MSREDERHAYWLTASEIKVIRGALRGRREDVQADPDYADDERQEHLEGIEGALDVAQYIRECESRVPATERRRGHGRRSTDLPGTPSSRAREVEGTS